MAPGYISEPLCPTIAVNCAMLGAAFLFESNVSIPLTPSHTIPRHTYFQLLFNGLHDLSIFFFFFTFILRKKNWGCYPVLLCFRILYFIWLYKLILYSYVAFCIHFCCFHVKLFGQLRLFWSLMWWFFPHTVNQGWSSCSSLQKLERYKRGVAGNQYKKQTVLKYKYMCNVITEWTLLNCNLFYRKGVKHAACGPKAARQTIL